MSSTHTVDQSKWSIKQAKYYMWELPETKISADLRRLAGIAKYYFYGNESTTHDRPISVINRTNYAKPNDLGLEVLRIAKEGAGFTFETFNESRNQLRQLASSRGLRNFLELEVCLKGWKMLMLDELMRDARTYPDEELDTTVAQFSLIWLREFFGERIFSPTEEMMTATHHCLSRMEDRVNEISQAPYPIDFVWRMQLLNAELSLLTDQLKDLFLNQIGVATKGVVGKDLQPNGRAPSNWDLSVFSYWKHHTAGLKYADLNSVWDLGETMAKDRAQDISRFLRRQSEFLRGSGFNAGSTYMTAEYIPLNLLSHIE